MFSLLLIVFAFSVYFYSILVENGNSIRTNMEAHNICNQVALSLSSLATYPGNVTYTFDLPDHLNYEDYTIYAVAATRYIRVDYSEGGVGCYIQTSRLSNSTGSTFFQIANNASITSNQGVIVVYP